MTLTDEELSKCLEIEADRNCLRIELERLRAKPCELLEDGRLLVCKNHDARDQLAEAAAFLDGLAERLETCVGIITNDPECPCQENAADCRAMAERLRK